MPDVLPPLTDRERLTATRTSWHALAEHVLAPAYFAVTGRIGLRATAAGFGTPTFTDADGQERRLRVEGVNLISERDGRTKWVVLASLATAARFAGIAPGAPPGWPYAAVTACEADAALPLDARSVELLGAWLTFAQAALAELRADTRPRDRPSEIQLWPEHFDLAFDLGDEAARTRGTFGASPGDDEHTAPYLYVTRWAGRTEDPFWNDATFAGASLGYAQLLDAAEPHDAALAFFRRGHEALHTG